MAHGSTVQVADTAMEYITFGKGNKTLVMISGVGDGFKTVKGTALPFSLLYHKYSKDYKVYVFSRRNRLPNGFTTRQMARDLAHAFVSVGIAKANVLGVSQGGMIAQWLAIDAPQLVEKTILCVTSPKLAEESQKTVRQWLTWAANGDYQSIFVDTAERSYTERRLRVSRPLYGITARLTAPKSFDRFIVNAKACLTHDTSNELASISCPTLIIGGEKDSIVGAQGSYLLSEGIPKAELHMYRDYGHGLYEEAPDFHERVMKFMRQPAPSRA